MVRKFKKTKKKSMKDYKRRNVKIGGMVIEEAGRKKKKDNKSVIGIGDETPFPEPPKPKPKSKPNSPTIKKNAFYLY